jgi:hypothetical protein
MALKQKSHLAVAFPNGQSLASQKCPVRASLRDIQFRLRLIPVEPSSALPDLKALNSRFLCERHASLATLLVAVGVPFFSLFIFSYLALLVRWGIPIYGRLNFGKILDFIEISLAGVGQCWHLIQK